MPLNDFINTFGALMGILLFIVWKRVENGSLKPRIDKLEEQIEKVEAKVEKVDANVDKLELASSKVEFKVDEVLRRVRKVEDAKSSDGQGN